MEHQTSNRHDSRGKFSRRPFRAAAPTNAVSSTPVKRRLAWRILALSLLPILLAIGVAVVLVDRQVRALTETEIEGQLTIARTLALDLITAREEDLLTEGWIVARDPKFFAMLAQLGLERDESYRRTLEDIAAQFASTLDSDRLEILDDTGVVQAQWEPRRSGYGLSPVPRDAKAEPDIAKALLGVPTGGVRAAEKGALVQTAAVPVYVGERIVGVLRHGRRIDSELLGRIRGLTRCEVAFTIGERLAESTLLGANESHLETTAPLQSSLDETITVHLYRSIEPEERFLAALRGHLVLIGLSIVAASLLFTRIVTRRLTEPVDALVRAAIHLERGDADTVIDIRTGDELEYLGRRFGEMRAALQSQIRALRELDRMKSTFLSVASHELRTPATIIQGNVDLLGYIAPPEDEQYPEILEGLQRGVTRLHGVLERIGDMALLDGERMRVSMRPMDARELLPDLECYWRRISAERSLEFHLVVTSEPTTVLADPGRIRQAVQSLLHNALRFTPDGGSVKLGLETRGGHVSFSVEDSGIGVPAEHRDRIFEAFYEARDVLNHRSGDTEFGAAGLGLGLALTRSIVQAHRGKVTYTALTSGGSRFIIELPLVSSARGGTELEEIAA